MIDIRNFEDIRPYQDTEVNPVLMKLLNNPALQKMATLFYPEMPFGDIKTIFSNIHSLADFQAHVTYHVLKKIISSSSTGVTSDGFNHIKKDKACLFISNHHDIVLDPSVLNLMLFEKGFNTTKIAIGDNLLTTDWIRVVARLNKSFIVHRNPSMKESYFISQRLSNFIKKSLLEENESVWIAQREGRAKDGNDITQVSLLKMLAFGGEDTYFEYLRTLNIVPVSISYEYDPCDILKVRELIEISKNKNYKKSVEEDVISMSTGLRGNKGRIHLYLGQILNNEFDGIVQHESTKEQFLALAATLDEKIQSSMRLWPTNFIAYDMLIGKKNHAGKYSADEDRSFSDYINTRLAENNLDTPDARIKLLSIYANPVKNKLRYTGF